MAVNIKWMKNINEKKTIYALVTLNVLILIIYGLILNFSSKINALGGLMGLVIISGGMRYFGETIVISYIGKFNNEWISGWSMGAGFTSICGVGIYQIMKTSKISEWIIVGLGIWFEILVAVLFYYVDKNQPFKVKEPFKVAKSAD